MKYISIRAAFGDDYRMSPPSKAVDRLWHHRLTATRNYVTMCRAAGRHMIHHDLMPKGSPELKESKQNTKILMKRCWGLRENEEGSDEDILCS